MSYDVAVWNTAQPLTEDEAGELYGRLCEGDIEGVVASPAIDALYEELTSKHPELDDVPDEEVDNVDFSPWSASIDRSPGHLIMPSVWSKEEYVHDLVMRLAAEHGLTFYDPQTGQTIPPGGKVARKKRRFWG